MLVLMTLTHIPTRWSDPLGQPFGFVSAAEGFVFLSGFMAGLVYAQRQRRDGDAAMRDAFLSRALKLYAIQAALLIFVLTVIALAGVLTQQAAITDLVSYFLAQPLTALLGGLLLLYNPPLLDILPMYVLFMLVSPLLLLHAGWRGWGGILTLSVALWLAAQFGLDPWLYDALVRGTGLPVPRNEVGAFEIVAWQFLWVLGLWVGVRQANGQPVQATPIPRWVVAAAVAVALVNLVWRHVGGQSPFGADTALNMLYDKWRLGPLRIIDFFALVVVVLHFGARLAARMPRPRWLELLGRQSLPVFCAHVVLAMLVLASFGAIDPARPLWQDTALLAACFAVLHAVARLAEDLDRRAAAAAKRLRAINERRAARRLARPDALRATPAAPSPAVSAPAARGEPRSPVATTHSPPG